MANIMNCSQQHEQIIRACLQTIQGVLNDWDLPCLTDVRDQMQYYLDDGLDISCEDCPEDGVTREDDAIIMCRNSLDNNSQDRTCAVIFHEMVHAAGGTELDAEALETHFFDGRNGNGATYPTDGDFDLFRSDGGEFVEWDAATGEIYEVCMDESYATSRGILLQAVFPG
jgi:hypothetical protein